MANSMPDFTEETTRNHQEFRMSSLTVSLRSIACISKMKKKRERKKENHGRKLLVLKAQFSIAHGFYYPLTLGKLSSLFAFTRQSARPLVICCFLLSALFCSLSWSCLSIVLYAKGRGFKNES